MSLQNYSGKSKNPFDDDEDEMASAFMNSSSAKYLASDRLGPSYEAERALSEEEERRNELLQQLRQVEQKTLDSSKRSLGMLIESENIGIETAQDLSRQREQLTNTENRLDDINSTLKDTQKNINGIKSVFSSLKQWWSTPKNPPAEDKDSKLNPLTPSSLTHSEKTVPVLSKNLSAAVEQSQSSLQHTKTSHPENMSSGLSRLKDLAKGLGTEIEEHTPIIDRIQTKLDKADISMTSQNTQMNRLLKR
ncbi:Synaptosomal-associated protein 29 [Armadillidium vulgare]|nr:Synaptosomal-associated protein 29 [Armadillidium vulgare]